MTDLNDPTLPGNASTTGNSESADSLPPESRPSHTNGHLNLPPDEAMRADARTDSVAGDAMLLFKIAGMTCHKCELAVGEALRGVRGVKEAEIDFNSGSGSVLYDPKAADAATLAEAITESGYDVVGFQKLGGGK